MHEKQKLNKNKAVSKLQVILSAFLIVAALYSSLMTYQSQHIAKAGGTSSSSSSIVSSSSSSSVSNDLEIKPSMLIPLDQNLNHDKTKDRLNLVFYSTAGTGSIEGFKDMTKLMIKNDSLDKSPLREHGAFDIEPYKSNINKFNFWFYNEQINIELATQFGSQIKTTPEIFGIDYIVPISLTDLSFDRSNADLPDLTFANDKRTVKRYLPGSVRLFYYGLSIYGTILAHELGHAIFSLADEYPEIGRSDPVINPPNCAPDQATATSWWGDLVGQVDPYFYTHRQNIIDYYLSKPDMIYLRRNDGLLEKALYNEQFDYTWTAVTNLNEILDENDYKVGYYPGGCFADVTTGAIRPTIKSMMNSNLDIFGSVNRRRMEDIFAIFSGEVNLILKKKPSDLDPSSFKIYEISDTDCNLKIFLSGKKDLTCTIKSNQPLISKTSTYKIAILPNTQEYTQEVKFDQINDLTTKSCYLNQDNSVFLCDPLDVSTLNNTDDYTLYFFYVPDPNLYEPPSYFPYSLYLLRNTQPPFDLFKLPLFPSTTEQPASSSSSSLQTSSTISSTDSSAQSSSAPSSLSSTSSLSSNTLNSSTSTNFSSSIAVSSNSSISSSSRSLQSSSKISVTTFNSESSSNLSSISKSSSTIDSSINSSSKLSSKIDEKIISSISSNSNSTKNNNFVTQIIVASIFGVGLAAGTTGYIFMKKRNSKLPK